MPEKVPLTTEELMLLLTRIGRQDDLESKNVRVTGWKLADESD
jgi:hypothetical protein